MAKADQAAVYRVLKKSVLRAGVEMVRARAHAHAHPAAVLSFVRAVVPVLYAPRVQIGGACRIRSAVARCRQGSCCRRCR